jgi:hypothetical protein
MEDISKLNQILDNLKSKYNISQPVHPEQFTLDQTINLLVNIESKYKTKSNNPTPKTKYSVLQDLVSKLEFELCIKESKNVDSILNEIIGCLRNETPESKQFCATQINKMLETNYFSSNIKKKLKALIELTL